MTTVRLNSSRIGPQSVSSPTTTVNSGAGRRPSAGAVRARVAISTRASARRWAGVRARSRIVGSRPRRALASAQSASKSSRSIMRSVVSTISPEIGSRVMLAEPHAAEALREVDLAGVAVVVGALLGAVGVDDHRPAVAGRLEVTNP